MKFINNGSCVLVFTCFPLTENRGSRGSAHFRGNNPLMNITVLDIALVLGLALARSLMLALAVSVALALALLFALALTFALALALALA